MSAACTSLSLSPTGDFLATTHVDYVGVFLWSNQTLYTHISLSQVSDSEAPFLDLPTTQSTSEQELDEHGADVKDPEPTYSSPDQITQDLITMSLIASSRWKNLLDIDVVKKRNKLKEKLKPTKAAPFFLPTIPSLTMEFSFSKEVEKEDTSKVRELSSLHSLSGFGKLLNESAENGDFESVIARFKLLGPSSVDFEMSLLAPDDGGSVDLMIAFIKLIEYMLESNRHFELAQAYLSLFLKKHGDLIASDSRLRDYIPNLQKCQIAGWHALQSKLMFSMCVIQTLKGI